MSRTDKDHPVLRRARQRQIAEQEPALANRRSVPARRTINARLADFRCGVGPEVLYAAEVA